MRTFLLAVSVITMMAMVGVYALLVVGESSVLGLEGVTGGSDASAQVGIAWTVVDRNVTEARITWTPDGSGVYTISVTVGSSVGFATVTSEGSVERTDTVAIRPSVDVRSITTAKVVTRKS